MKKIFKKLKLRDIIFIFLGVIIGGSIGITATTYVLQSSEIQYTNDKSVQQAIDELYTLAENAGGNNEKLPIGAATIVGYKITVPYTGDYPTIRCVYGVDENYGSEGTISNNTCYFKGTSANQTLYYKIVATDNAGKIYESSGSNITASCNLDDNGNCIKSTIYTTGDAMKLGGYNWHVIGDTGTNLTLLMDSNQLGSNSNMAHTSSGATYSWNKSKIRTYLNGTFLSDLESKIINEIVATEICTDPSKESSSSTTYGGYLMSELSALGKTNLCSTTVSDKVRLISYYEYYNMSPRYSTSSSSPNVENITKIPLSSDYASWLFCTSTSCGNSSGYWWTMGSYANRFGDEEQKAYNVAGGDTVSVGNLRFDYGTSSFGVRPVITIVK